MTNVKRLLILAMPLLLIACSENESVSDPSTKEILESPAEWVDGEMKIADKVLNLEFPRGSRLSEHDSVGVIETTSGQALAFGKNISVDQLKKSLDGNLEIESLTCKGYRVVVTEGFKDSVTLVFKNVPS